jgi:L-cysteine desulfidase
VHVSRYLPGVQVALGCSEPGAIALAAAAAARALGGEVHDLSVVCDSHTLKNASGAGLPGGGGRHGPRLAAALGAVGGDPARALEVLADLGREDWELAEGLVAQGRVKVSPSDIGAGEIFVEVQVAGARGRARARIEGSHSRLTELEVEGAALPLPSASASLGPPPCLPGSLESLLELARTCDAEDRALLLEGLSLNLAVARGGLEREPEGLAPGARAELYAAAGSRERMEGCPGAVQTSGYSGNQGLVATIPVWAQAQALELDQDALVTGLAFSHLVGRLVRERTGVISALCNAVQAASAGAAAACVVLRGGDLEACRRAVELTLAGVAGTLCDGAKPGCGLKVGLGASRALQNADNALAGFGPSRRDGVVGGSLEGTLDNLERLAKSLSGANEALLGIVLEKGS